LTLEHWDKTTLDSVVARALAPFQEKHADRILIHGPADVWLGANTALLMAMALHELATNAVKHGALSNGIGQVHLGWDYAAEAAKARFLWCERGGPPVKPPKRSGFGSRLIGSAMRGAATLDFRADGLVCTLEIGVGDGLSR
jgi:two-component sensor histidine kinase